ncbi:MAG: hypothetical protein WC822_04510 [Candidatus Paceibacterota bacterium]|jgi:DNA-binding CsgD family transcriptional regulator
MNHKGIVLLKHISRGVHLKEAAILMGRSYESVKHIVDCMRRENGCRNNTELVVGAILSGIIAIPEEYEIVNPYRVKELRERRK